MPLLLAGHMPGQCAASNVFSWYFWASTSATIIIIMILWERTWGLSCYVICRLHACGHTNRPICSYQTVPVNCKWAHFHFDLLLLRSHQPSLLLLLLIFLLQSSIPSTFAAPALNQSYNFVFEIDRHRYTDRSVREIGHWSTKRQWNSFIPYLVAHVNRTRIIMNERIEVVFIMTFISFVGHKDFLLFMVGGRLLSFRSPVANHTIGVHNLHYNKPFACLESINQLGNVER